MLLFIPLPRESLVFIHQLFLAIELIFDYLKIRLNLHQVLHLLLNLTFDSIDTSFILFIVELKRGHAVRVFVSINRVL